MINEKIEKLKRIRDNVRHNCNCSMCKNCPYYSIHQIKFGLPYDNWASNTHCKIFKLKHDLSGQNSNDSHTEKKIIKSYNKEIQKMIHRRDF